MTEHDVPLSPVVAASVLFAGIPEAAVARVLGLFVVRRLTSGERIDAGRGGVGVVVDGCFRDAGGEVPPRVGGDVVTTLRGTLVAETPTEVAWLSMARLDELATDAPALAFEVLRRAASLAAGPEGAATATLADRFPHAPEGSPVVAARVRGALHTLDTHVPPDVEATPVTTDAWEGKDIYRRTAALALLAAAARTGIPVTLGATLTTGRVVHTRDARAFAGALHAALAAVVEADLPVMRETWGVAEAMRHFDQRGDHDAASLLGLSSSPVTSLVRCGDARALAVGPTLPSTGRLTGLSLEPHPSGLLLDFGQAVRRSLAREQSSTRVMELYAPRFGGEMVNAERAWLERLGIRGVADLSRASVSGQVRKLVRVAEGFHEKRIASIADAILSRGAAARVVGIAGPSSSGKTTFISRLSVQLDVVGVRPVALSLDDYYIDRERTVRDAAGEYDFEALDALDLPLLRRHVHALLGGEAVKTARYDFTTGRSHPEGGPELVLEPGSVLMLEGIHALSPALLPDLSDAASFRVFIHPSLALPLDALTVVEPAEVRLLRRLVRDRHQRGHTASATLARWPSVRRGERLHIYPHLAHADFVFDSSLAYELGVLRVYAERYLMEIDREDPTFATATRLRRLIEHVVPIHADHVPDDSILREFLGPKTLSL